MNDNRKVPVSKKDLTKAVRFLHRRLRKSREKHGVAAYVDVHHTYGIIAEEFQLELLEAMHTNDNAAAYKELADIAGAALWGMASISAQSR